MFKIGALIVCFIKEKKMTRKLLLLTVFSVLAPGLSLAAVNKPALIKKPVLVNVNKASEQQLLTLKGVGAKKAKAVIAYRKQHGRFSSANDLLKVKGFSSAIIKSNKKKIEFDK